MKTREDNPFEDPEIAAQWIASVESDEGSRMREIYPLLREWSTGFAGAVVLDIGAGQGICSPHIQAGGYVGIEPSSTLVNRARELYGEDGKEFQIGNAYEIPLPDNSVDGAFCVGVWFHIEDLDRAHKELSRVLKPNGKLLIITSNPDTHSMWESFFETPLKEGKIIDGKVRLPNQSLTRNRFYLHSEKEITESLERSGFSISKIKKFGFGKDDKREVGIWMAIEASYN